MSKFVVSPDLITRFSDGQVHLHTLETARSVTFPNLWVINVLDHFSRPASEDEFADRLRRVRQEMAKREIDTLIVSDPAGILRHAGGNLLLADGFAAIAKDNPALFSSLLFRTPSGMAISYPGDQDAVLGPIVGAFTETDERVRALWKEGRARREKLDKTD